ncbi:MAG: hypothetical protein D4R82_00270 [Dehalococcoidia bacterium]|nr:MAG: hypothetical protein D4R82_00270 [Dehalococcoidia bacterium]
MKKLIGIIASGASTVVSIWTLWGTFCSQSPLLIKAFLAIWIVASFILFVWLSFPLWVNIYEVAKVGIAQLTNRNSHLFLAIDRIIFLPMSGGKNQNEIQANGKLINCRLSRIRLDSMIMEMHIQGIVNTGKAEIEFGSKDNGITIVHPLSAIPLTGKTTSVLPEGWYETVYKMAQIGHHPISAELTFKGYDNRKEIVNIPKFSYTALIETKGKSIL